MHLVRGLTTTGKRRGKQKFRSADEAKKARELEESWSAMKKKWNISDTSRKSKRGLSAEPWVPTTTTYRRETPHIPSLPFTGDACSKREQNTYTGTKIVGIGTLHKSNSVPVFSDEEAVDIAHMRR